ncbi:hypothetical protein GJU40_16180 [Bacillus lacus]|uniref:WD40 repeat domain-containing protein n=1 Tax=Metabacillus lacus TaxID=1983721 RepID=A0A7X2J1E6_9BACI|nr:hypothetical protein [Metabacillus lacus]MRX73681.1 hypothetical protein [Metabacillus lacus]
MKFFRFILSASLILFLFPSTFTAAASSPYENLGPQVQYVNVIKGKAGVNSLGQPLYYALLQGEPAKFVVIDLHSNRVIDLKELKGAKAAWSIEISPDNKVWVGTTPNEHVFQYNPDTRELSDLGKATTNSDTVVWDLTYDKKGSRLFGVTSYGGRLFSYDAQKGFQNYGQAVHGKQYARSVVFDEEKDYLYAGVGSTASLIKWDLKTGVKKDILPAQYRPAASVYDMDIQGRSLFAKIEGKSEILKFNLDSEAMETVIQADSRGVSPAHNGLVYYSFNSKLHAYHLESGQIEQLSNTNLYNSSAVSLDIVNLRGEPTVVGLAGNGGRFFTYGIQSKRFTSTNLELPPQAVEIYRIGSGADGQIYSSGFISGRLGVFDSTTSQSNMYQGLGQIEGFAQLNQTMFFGVYPNGRVYEFDSTKAWEPGKNPKEILTLGDKGQDRPIAMQTDKEKNQLYIGTIPKRGQSQGAFLVYDLKERRVIHEISVPYQQSVSSMTYSEAERKLYIGTSVFDGSGQRSVLGAQLFAVSTDDPQFTLRPIGLPGGYSVMVSALATGQDGTLWGIVDNKLMKYHSQDQRPLMYPINPHQVKGMFKNENLVFGHSGELFGTLQGTLFKVNPATNAITNYRSGEVFHLAKDPRGYLYYNSGANLWKIDPSKLTKEYELVPGQLFIPNVPVENAEFPVARVYSKQPLILYKKQNNSMVPVQQLAAKKFYRVYGTSGQYYHVGGEHYIYHEDHKVSLYIGRVFTLTQAPILKPDGSVFRLIQPGEEIRVYQHDEHSYDVGNGYKVMKNEDVSYYIGTVTLGEETQLYQYGETEPVLQLSKGETYEIYKTDGQKLDIGNGYYINFQKNKMEFKKN